MTNRLLHHRCMRILIHRTRTRTRTSISLLRISIRTIIIGSGTPARPHRR